jgi:hypothetical protein
MEESRAKRWVKLLEIGEDEIESNPINEWSSELNHPDQVM